MIQPGDLPVVLGGVVDEVAALLDGLGVPFMIIGGLAIGVHVEARATKDADLSVAVDEEQAVGLLDEMARLGYLARTHGTLGPGAVIRFSRTGADGIVRWVDVLCAGTPFEHRAIERSERRRLLGREVRVATVEDLLVLKLLAGRPQDVADAVRLVAEHGSRLDRAYLDAAVAEWELGAELARIEEMARQGAE